MRNRIKTSTIVLLLGLALPRWAEAATAATAESSRHIVITTCREPAALENLAAREVRRYLYLRTGRLLPIVRTLPRLPRAKAVISVGQKGSPAVSTLVAGDRGLSALVDSLGPQQYLLKTISRNDRPTLLIIGGDELGTLYGSYRFAEHLGVRFYLHGDVIPEQRIDPEIPRLNETGRPLFETRGIQPFHDFPEGPDWWNTDDYKAILTQLAKLRMNFLGLHTYPQGGVGPEPTVWIGAPGEFNHDGTVRAAYPARHFTTANVTGAWGYKSAKTGDYSFGAALLFERDDYGADYMLGMNPWTELSQPRACELFNRMGHVLKEAFEYARALGVKTCVGTETPLVIPTAVKQRLTAAGKDPAKPDVVQEIYEAIFERIERAYPIDYYWFWTPEGWTWGNVKNQQVEATLADFKAAIAAAEKVNASFTLATCGWVLGPPNDRAAFDNFLPKEVPMSCINRNVGFSFVEPGFAKVHGRPKWAIPWLEDDPALIIPQLWVGRTRRDAADALAYGCTGLLGIHWRTRILGPMVSALAHAAWDQTGWNPDFGKKARTTEPTLGEGRLGGQVAAFGNNPIAETDEDAVYQTVVYNLEAYRIKVPNGSYTVTLKFCEPHYNQAGKRVFGVKLQGRKVIDRLDVFAKVGKNRAIDYTFDGVEVTDQILTVEFTRDVEYPCIAGIVVEGKGLTRKINCGGGAYKDYQADLLPAGADNRPRDLPSYDFYLDWARSQFGPDAAEAAAKIFTSLDGGPAVPLGQQRNTNLPRPSTWVRGPGGIRPDPRPWKQVSKDYEFVDKFAALAPTVKGSGNRERFDYWLANFRYLRAVARANCTWARFNEAIKKAKQAKDADARKRLAREVALPIRKELVTDVAGVHTYLLSAVNTPGGMGNVTNWQQHLMPTLLTQPGRELAQLLGEDLRPEAMPSKRYQGPTRLFVPTVRSTLTAGEDLRIKAILLDPHGPAEMVLYWRPMGSGDFEKVRLNHVARGVYSAEIPAGQIQKRDIEYYVRATTANRVTLTFPATAPQLNQTVVIMDR